MEDKPKRRVAFENMAKEMLRYLDNVGGVYIAREQYSSSGEGAAGVSLGAVHMEEGVQVRVQVECGREEVNDDQTLIMDDMKME